MNKFNLIGYEILNEKPINIYQGQAIGVAAAIANQKAVPLNQITSAEVRQKLENLTDRQTRLRSLDRIAGKDFGNSNIALFKSSL